MRRNERSAQNGICSFRVAHETASEDAYRSRSGFLGTVRADSFISPDSPPEVKPRIEPCSRKTELWTVFELNPPRFFREALARVVVTDGKGSGYRGSERRIGSQLRSGDRGHSLNCDDGELATHCGLRREWQYFRPCFQRKFI